MREENTNAITTWTRERRRLDARPARWQTTEVTQ